LLQHFWLWHSKESAPAPGGSFAHKTTAEGAALLDCILENTSSIEPLPVDNLSSLEEVLLVESTALLLTYPDSSAGPSPEPETRKKEEIQLLEFPLEFEEELFKDFRNTSNYPHQRKPPVPNTPKKDTFLETAQIILKLH